MVNAVPRNRKNDYQDIEVPLPQAVDAIMLFLKKHAMRGADFSGVRRKDIWSIPVNILREVVINALVHADYSHRGTPTRVAFFDDRIEVESPGLLLPGVTVHDMKQGVSQIRNPVLARVFRELELVEQWGSGVPGIFAQAKDAGLPEPAIEEIAGRVRFTVRLAEPLPLLAAQSRRSGAGDAQPLGPGAQSVTILQLLQSQALSSNELQLQMGLQSKTGAFKRAIKDLLDSGQI